MPTQRRTSKTASAHPTTSERVPSSAEVRTHETSRKPTESDGAMLLRCASLHAEMRLGMIQGWLWSDDFEPDHMAFRNRFPAGSERSAQIHELIGWYETVGTLWKNGLISSTLLFDWLAVSLAWDKLGGICRGERDEAGEPRLYENFEMMALAQRAT